jgi:putative flippase GtrA
MKRKRPGMARATSFLRYAVTGVFAFSVDMAITLMLATRWHYLVANAIAFIVANFLQFFIVHHWVFRQPFSGDSLLRKYVGTLSISAFGLACTSLLVYIGVDLLLVPLPITKTVVAIVVLFINYSLRVALLYRQAGATHGEG